MPYHLAMLTFFVPGTPVGQPRPRACIRGGHAGVYDPGTADEWKQAIKEVMAVEYVGMPIDVACSMRLSFWFRRPRTHFRRGRLVSNAPTVHSIKPDIDNCVKAVMDALVDAEVLKDDSKVWFVLATKQYADDGHLTGCDIKINTNTTPETET